MKLAIIDDYQSASTKFADWKSIEGVVAVPFRDHVFDPKEPVARLSDLMQSSAFASVRSFQGPFWSGFRA